MAKNNQKWKRSVYVVYLNYRSFCASLMTNFREYTSLYLPRLFCCLRTDRNRFSLDLHVIKIFGFQKHIYPMFFCNMTPRSNDISNHKSLESHWLPYNYYAIMYVKKVSKAVSPRKHLHTNMAQQSHLTALYILMSNEDVPHFRCDQKLCTNLCLLMI